jgi:hypothetical protein
MSDRRQKEIEKALKEAVVPSNVCESVENFGNVISEFRNEVDEEHVVHAVFSSVFHKYNGLRSVSKELRQKLDAERASHTAERASHAASIRTYQEKVRALERTVDEMRATHSNQVAAMKLKLRRFEEEEKVRKIHAAGARDKNGEVWLSTRRPVTSTQLPSRRQQITKKRGRQNRVIPETQDTDDDDDDHSSPSKIFHHDTCQMSEIQKQ